MNSLLLKQIEIYKKILEINFRIKETLIKSQELNVELIEKLMESREKMMLYLKEIDKELEPLWNNWEDLKDKINKKYLNEIKNILDENKSIEEEILSLFREKLEIIKFKLKDYDKGKKALHGYRQVKVNIPMFKSFKI